MNNEIERVKTGVQGFDELIDGGFPKDFLILVSGTPGTGKSIFGLEYLYYGAERGEKGLYVSILQNSSDLVRQAKMFGMDFQSLIGEDVVEIFEMDLLDFHITNLLNDIKEGGYDRVVIDSLSNIVFHPISWRHENIVYAALQDIDEIIPDPAHPKVFNRILTERFMTELKKTKATTLVLTESADERDFDMNILPESLSDGVIHLTYNLRGPSSERNLIIQKMRSTRHSEVIHPMEFIEGEGIRVIQP